MLVLRMPVVLMCKGQEKLLFGPARRHILLHLSNETHNLERAIIPTFA